MSKRVCLAVALGIFLGFCAIGIADPANPHEIDDTICPTMANDSCGNYFTGGCCRLGVSGGFKTWILTATPFSTCVQSWGDVCIAEGGAAVNCNGPVYIGTTGCVTWTLATNNCPQYLWECS
jgi:hypothetical protein